MGWAEGPVKRDGQRREEKRQRMAALGRTDMSVARHGYNIAPARRQGRRVCRGVMRRMLEATQ